MDLCRDVGPGNGGFELSVFLSSSFLEGCVSIVCCWLPSRFKSQHLRVAYALHFKALLLSLKAIFQLSVS
jgi:hypothetical protein